jgi:hypothetical protein
MELTGDSGHTNRGGQRGDEQQLFGNAYSCDYTDWAFPCFSVTAQSPSESSSVYTSHDIRYLC